jgi:hypothetical protein
VIPEKSGVTFLLSGDGLNRFVAKKLNYTRPKFASRKLDLFLLE